MSAWDFSVKDWADRLRAGRSLLPKLPLDEKAAADAIGIFDNLRLPDVVGNPPFREAAGDWFREIVAALFGSVVGEERMVREAFLMLPKKSSKTTGGAGLMITALLLNKRPRAEFLLIGPTKFVADLAYSQASGMIASDEEGYLQRRFHVQDHLRQITDRRYKSKLLIKAFDSSVLTGVKPAGVLLDELHEISRDPAATRVIGQLRGGLLPIPEAFLVFITTQSDEPPAGAFRAELRVARAVRDGVITGSHMLPVLYEFPEDIARPATMFGEDPPWYDPKLWWMVTPNRDRSVTIDRLRQDFDVAKEKGLTEIARWASQHLNVEIGLALRNDAWAGAEFWQQQADPELNDLDVLIERSEVVTIGADAGGLDDLASMAVLGRDAVTGDWLAWVRTWLHPIVLQRHKSEAAKLLDFVAAGELVLVDRIGQDLEEMSRICEHVDATGKLAQVGVDAMGIGGLIDALDAAGIIGDRVLAIPQGYQLNSSIKTAERKLAEGSLWHADQKSVSWAVSNARVEQRGNAIIITKAASGSAKIDPVIAILNAIALMSRNPKPQRKPTFQAFILGSAGGVQVRQ